VNELQHASTENALHRGSVTGKGMRKILHALTASAFARELREHGFDADGASALVCAVALEIYR
jgi:hypothetical protein